MAFREIRGHIFTLFAISLGGLLLHLRIHPPGKEAVNWFAAGFGVISVFAVPALFCGRRTAPWAYLLNLLSVILGTVTMAWYSVSHWQGDVTLWALLTKTTLPDILILCGKLYPAAAIMAIRRRGSGGSPPAE